MIPDYTRSKYWFAFYPMRVGISIKCGHKHKTCDTALLCAKKQTNSTFWQVTDSHDSNFIY